MFYIRTCLKRYLGNLCHEMATRATVQTYPNLPQWQGYLMFLQRLEQEADGLKRVSIHTSHVLFDVGDLAPIEQSKYKGIENGEGMRSRPLAYLTRIFGKSAIPAILQAIFNGA